MPPISDSQHAARLKAVQEHFRLENTHDLDAVMDTFGNTCSFVANQERHEGRRIGLGEEFLSCVEACLDAIRRTPEMHAVVHENYRRAWSAAFRMRLAFITERRSSGKDI